MKRILLGLALATFATLAIPSTSEASFRRRAAARAQAQAGGRNVAVAVQVGGVAVSANAAAGRRVAGPPQRFNRFGRGPRRGF